QLVRIVADDLAVLAAPRFRFISVDDQGVGFAGLWLLWHEGSFHAGREARAAAAAKPRRLHLVDDRVLPDREQRLGIVPIAALLRRRKVRRLEAVDVGEDAVLVRERPGVAHQKAPASWAMKMKNSTMIASRANLIMPFTNLNAPNARTSAKMMYSQII